MKKTLIIFSLLLLLCLCVGSVSASSQGGYDSGTNTYYIYDADDLNAFAALINSDISKVSIKAKLMDNIDMVGTSDFVGIGTASNIYAGEFDGNGKTISNLKLTTLKYLSSSDGHAKGLITVANNVYVHDLKIDNAYAGYTTTESYNTNRNPMSFCCAYVIGGNNNRFERIDVSGTVDISSTYGSGQYNTVGFGGIVGSTPSTSQSITINIVISDCVADVSCDVTASRYPRVGQIISTSNGLSSINVIIHNCYANGDSLDAASTRYRVVAGGIAAGCDGGAQISIVNVAALGDTITYSNGGSGSTLVYRIIGDYSGSGISYAYANSAMTINGATVSGGTATNNNGADVTAAQYNSESWWKNTANWNSQYPWDWTNTWYWDSTTNLPKLQVFNQQPPIISSISSPDSPSAINTAVSSTVTASPSVAGNTLTYVWQYSTDGTTYNTLSGQTTATMTYTPTTTGTYRFKVTVTETETGLSTTSSVVQSVIVTAPTLGTATISQTKGKTGTAYTPTITYTVSNMGGASAVYLICQESTDGQNWANYGQGKTLSSPGSTTFEPSITDATGTTHYYRALATTLSGVWSGSTVATSNTVSFTTYAAPDVSSTALTLNPSTLRITTAGTVSITGTGIPTSTADNPYTYTLYYGSSQTPGAGDTSIGVWSDTTQAYSWIISASQFQAAGNQYVYLKITDSVGNEVKSSAATFTLTNTAPPTINSLTLTSSSPALTDTTVTATVSAVSYEGTTANLAYKWYYSPSDSVAWTEITGQTTASLSTSFSVSGTYYIKAVVTDTSISEYTDSYTAGKYATVQIVPVPAIASVSVNPYTLDLSVSTQVQLSSVITNPDGVASMVWQMSKDNGAWQNTALTQTTGYVTVSTAGTYLFRLQVTPIVGSAITSSNTHSVIAGTLPTVQITNPSGSTAFGIGETIQVNATGSGIDSLSWNFGEGVKASGNTQTLTPWVQYSTAGSHTITLTVSNGFGSKQVSVKIIVSSTRRPVATATPEQIKDADAIFTWLESTEPQSAEDQSPDIWGIFTGLFKPFTSIMGQWFYLALFAVPYLLIWLRTRNTMIPSIIGILFGSWLLVMLPSTAMAAAICILILSVSGGIFGIYLSRRQRE